MKTTIIVLMTLLLLGIPLLTVACGDDNKATATATHIATETSKLPAIPTGTLTIAVQAVHTDNELG